MGERRRCRECGRRRRASAFPAAANCRGAAYGLCMDCAHRAQFARNIKHRYGLTVEEFARLEGSQDGTCAICDEADPKGLHVDHCHETGKVRGLLCGHCNLALGHMRDDLRRMRRAISYLAGR